MSRARAARCRPAVPVRGATADREMSRSSRTVSLMSFTLAVLRMSEAGNPQENVPLTCRLSRPVGACVAAPDGSRVGELNPQHAPLCPPWPVVASTDLNIRMPDGMIRRLTNRCSFLTSCSRVSRSTCGKITNPSGLTAARPGSAGRWTATSESRASTVVTCHPRSASQGRAIHLAKRTMAGSDTSTHQRPSPPR